MKNPLLFLVALTGLASCSKHNDPQATPAQPTLSRAELLTAGPWKLTAQRDVVTPQTGGAAVTRNFTVAPGTLNVIYNPDGTTSTSSPALQGNPSSGGIYTLVDSVIWSNVSPYGIIREITATRLVLVNNWQDPNELTQRTDTFTH